MSMDTASGGGGACDDSVCVVYNVTLGRIDASICANNIIIEKFSKLAQHLYKKYQCEMALIEQNGIGTTMIYACRELGMSVIKLTSTESSKYDGMQWAKKMIEKNKDPLIADENLRNNCLSVQIIAPRGKGGDSNKSAGSFVGKKDFLMTIGFLGAFSKYYLRPDARPTVPYINPQTHFPGLSKKPKGQKPGLFK